jgi:hypothetical protein
MARSGNRRQFLRTLGGTALALGAPFPSGAAWAGRATPKSLVVVVSCKKALTHGYDADRGALRAMVEAGLCRLSGRPDLPRALATYLRPTDRVGYKINGLAGREAATHVELVDVLAGAAKHGGIDPQKQIAFDRLTSDLTRSRFRPDGGAYHCMGNDDFGHEQDLAQMPSSASRLALTLTRRVDALVNLPVLKQHMLAGMTGALKNHFGCIHNPNKMHLSGCDPYVAEVNALPVIRSKQKLIIMDALRPIVHGGPSYQAAMAVPAHQLLFATDPVALDTVALGILEQLRARRGLPSLAKIALAPRYLATAATMGLGVGDRARIELVTLEV